MREMKPLILPKLVAQRKSSKGSLNMPSEPSLSIHSNTDSGFYSASECSTPPTPSFHHGHLRFPSSTSSLSSSPPSQETILDHANASGKLPKLTEDIEQEDDYLSVDPYRPSIDVDMFDDHAISEAYDFDVHGVAPKRQRSTKLERSFPSFSRKVREQRRRASATLGKSSGSNTPSRHPSTRSSSITSSIHQIHSRDLSDSYPSSLPVTARSSTEKVNESIVSLPIDIAKANENALQLDLEEIESERYATTPLLPPMLITNHLDNTPTRSPLQSPTVATTDPIHSLVTTPVDSPPARAYPTPPLSTKASVASFKTRSSPLVPSTEIPPIMLADSGDKWAQKLGHDNFTIVPEPYMPEVCNAITRDALFADWQQARYNFTKHQVRIAEHYGPTSTVYKLCEDKWEETDAEWKKNLELVKLLVPAEPSAPNSPTMPLPADGETPWPTLNDPKSEGKFPKLGDEDIVGPMERIPPKVAIQPITPRKRAFFKFLQDLKFTSAFLGRSSSAGVRRH